MQSKEELTAPLDPYKVVVKIPAGRSWERLNQWFKNAGISTFISNDEAYGKDILVFEYENTLRHRTTTFADLPSITLDEWEEAVKQEWLIPTKEYCNGLEIKPYPVIKRGAYHTWIKDENTFYTNNCAVGKNGPVDSHHLINFDHPKIPDIMNEQKPYADLSKQTVYDGMKKMAAPETREIIGYNNVLGTMEEMSKNIKFVNYNEIQDTRIKRGFDIFKGGIYEKELRKILTDPIFNQMFKLVYKETDPSKEVTVKGRVFKVFKSGKIEVTACSNSTLTYDASQWKNLYSDLSKIQAAGLMRVPDVKVGITIKVAIDQDYTLSDIAPVIKAFEELTK